MRSGRVRICELVLVVAGMLGASIGGFAGGLGVGEVHALERMPAYVGAAEARRIIARVEPLVAQDGAVSSAERVGILLQLALAYRSLGRYSRAAELVTQVYGIAGKSAEPRVRAEAYLGLGDTLLLQGERRPALAAFEQALLAARDTGDNALEAAALNAIGNARHALGELEAAREAYLQARERATAADSESFSLALAANLGRVEASLGRASEASRVLTGAARQSLGLPESPGKGFSQLAVGRACEFAHRASAEASLLTAAELLYEQVALQHADDAHLRSLANGYLGGLRLGAGDLAAARTLNEDALFGSRQVQALELSSRWYWQSGRIARAEGRAADALAAFRKAVELTRAVRTGPVPRRLPDSAGDSTLYFELAEALIDESQALAAPDSAERLLEARATIELLKSRELEDYFEDRCVAAFAAGRISVDAVASATAVLYLVPLKDRLELLLSIGGAVQRETVPVPAQRLDETVDRFRRHLETRTNRRYLREARTLYDWIVRPLEDALAEANVDTLVFVPHGKLFTVPLAALNDGERFLASRYAVATTPGLDLTDARVLERASLRVLLAGISEENQGFAAIPQVEAELDAVSGIYPSVVLKNEGFRLARFNEALEREAFSVVHVASHGQFSANPDETFLLAYDDRITMDALEELLRVTEFRTDPVELLTLSACQTAAGDARSALGLAGVAVKSGARSALATLWFVDDASSARVVEEFYRALATSEVSKARALSAAQMSVAADPRYAHPAYWAAFLLIGNWL